MIKISKSGELEESCQKNVLHCLKADISLLFLKSCFI